MKRLTQSHRSTNYKMPTYLWHQNKIWFHWIKNILYHCVWQSKGCVPHCITSVSNPDIRLNSVSQFFVCALQMGVLIEMMIRRWSWFLIRFFPFLRNQDVSARNLEIPRGQPQILSSLESSPQSSHLRVRFSSMFRNKDDASKNSILIHIAF